MVYHKSWMYAKIILKIKLTYIQSHKMGKLFNTRTNCMEFWVLTMLELSTFFLFGLGCSRNKYRSLENICKLGRMLLFPLSILPRPYQNSPLLATAPQFFYVTFARKIFFFSWNVFIIHLSIDYLTFRSGTRKLR